MDFEGFAYGYDFDSPNGPGTRMSPALQRTPGPIGLLRCLHAACSPVPES